MKMSWKTYDVIVSSKKVVFFPCKLTLVQIKLLHSKYSCRSCYCIHYSLNSHTTCLQRCLVFLWECCLRSPFSTRPWEEGLISLACGVCAILWVVWGQRNNKVFRGVERDTCEIWSLVRYHVSLWASISKAFCNNSLGVILHSSSPFCGLIFLSPLYSFIFFSMKVAFSYK